MTGRRRFELSDRSIVWIFLVPTLLLLIGITLCVMAVAGAVPDWSMLIGWSMSGLGVGLSLPMLGVLMLKLAPRERHGNYSSALQLCAALCTSAALAAGGLAFSVLEASLPMAAWRMPKR